MKARLQSKTARSSCSRDGKGALSDELDPVRCVLLQLVGKRYPLKDVCTKLLLGGENLLVSERPFPGPIHFLMLGPINPMRSHIRLAKELNLERSDFVFDHQSGVLLKERSSMV